MTGEMISCAYYLQYSPQLSPCLVKPLCKSKKARDARCSSYKGGAMPHILEFSAKKGWFLQVASPQQSDLRLSGPPSNQGTGGGAQTRDRRVPIDLRADSLATVPPMFCQKKRNY
ncbi:hypothetical protein PoB_000163200 [Plakobranchus ocellatus]|uniref:Uncharacterized protein n=1 Tax=Plakobranchus ocellatus TaxID=259542 RepID=A0AAV3XZ51_9GAST|nr:hypothetical protein PoB_000163200 [Plakobranchus ocellatus]